jgi:hypothetical protein
MHNAQDKLHLMQLINTYPKVEEKKTEIFSWVEAVVEAVLVLPPLQHQTLLLQAMRYDAIHFDYSHQQQRKKKNHQHQLLHR